MFLDEKGIIRTKGRFDLDSSLILLPQHSRFTDLLILDYHQQLHHIGVGGTIVALRKRFWVPSARSVTRNLLRKCLKCKRVTGRHYPLPMSAELPTFRVDTSSHPFSNIGVDFTGHLIVKDLNGNFRKVYIFLFTCLNTRAISLEIVEDLTTESFLMTFRRHCSVFSTPSFILADNALTFKRAEKDLQQLLSLFETQSIQHAFAQRRIVFCCIPARSPHWGGVYERLIGLTKTSLITMSELKTLINEIQAVLNDRPLTYVYSDANDLQPLTPSHLLFGFSITSSPHPSAEETLSDPTYGDHDNISYAHRRRSVLYHHFMDRFCKEYLSLLRETHSFHDKGRRTSCSTVNVGDVVLVADTDTPRHCWQLGVVTELIVGADSLCRVAVVRTSKGCTTRSIVKLYPLEVQAGSHSTPEEGTENNEEHSNINTRPQRKAAFVARDIIHAQLIDNLLD